MHSHPNIQDRKFFFCEKLSAFDPADLIVQCPTCTRFFAACCQHDSFGGNLYDPEKPVCQHLQLVFTDGACSNNGRGYAARAGLGIVIGDDDFSWSITVDDALDSAPRTNQRAELLAAIQALKKLEQLHHPCSDIEDEKNYSGARRRANDDYRATHIVVTDSEYVVKGITEWFPEWRVCLCHFSLIPKIS